MVKKLISNMSLTGNGLRDWLIQRFSSIVLTVYFITLFVFFLSHKSLDYNAVRMFFASIVIQIFTLFALLSLLLHAWVGIWTVITDYFHPFIFRFIVQIFVMIALLIYFFWGLEILWKLI